MEPMPAEPPMLPEKPGAAGDSTNLRGPRVIETSGVNLLRSSRRTAIDSPAMEGGNSPVRQVQHMEPIGSGIRR